MSRSSRQTQAVLSRVPSERAVRSLVRQALREDLGSGDPTTDVLIPADLQTRAKIVSRSRGVLAGSWLLPLVFRESDRKLRIILTRKDGDRVSRGTSIAKVSGPARGILKGERVALNFLGRLSGVATATANFLVKMGHVRLRLLDTRKTTPGLRSLEKYAVRVGGGSNHRMRLDEGILVKDNHIALLDPSTRTARLREAVRTWRRKLPRSAKIGLEAESLSEVREFAGLVVDFLLLDNLSDRRVERAVRLCRAIRARRGLPPLVLEVSGGVTPERARRLGRLGVDQVSVGALTHSAPSLDFSLDILR